MAMLTGLDKEILIAIVSVKFTGLAISNVAEAEIPSQLLLDKSNGNGRDKSPESIPILFC